MRLPLPTTPARLGRAALTLLTGLGLAVPALAQEQIVRWPGNGHFYEVVVVPAGLTWTEAEAAARARGGALASLNTAAENRFVWSLIAGQPRYWSRSLRQGQTDGVGPWIGLVQVRHHQQEPAQGWRWLSGDALGEASWAPGRPNNLEQIEDYGHFFRVAGSGLEASWNDLPNDPRELKSVRTDRPVAYIVEYATPPRR